MRPTSLLYLRVKPMAAWSVSGSLLRVGRRVLDPVEHNRPGPTLLASVVVVLMQYVAAPDEPHYGLRT